ncbi:MarR family winged helix-turn-helix transcriptional regulator [Demequina sp.]|uniref:MarR family winged helix-turn-helix transcriptional regulator n=1 Tax=Demequina sp. TaxID=2050685 RepID=UPI0025DA2337|nr:MarR family winged helix-turn-helix transcriptional regulator [Demequina sp.]
MTTDTSPVASPGASVDASSGASSRGRTRLANDAWEAALGAHSALMRRFAEEDVWHGVSMREYDVLYTLSKCDSPQRLSELGRHVLLSQPALSRLVDRLVERGLVGRCVDPSDARAAHLSLTSEGRDLQRRIGRAHGAAVAAALTTALSDQELALLETLSRKLADKEPT